MKITPNFTNAIEWVGQQMRHHSYEVRGTKWQSVDVSKKPEMRMREVLNVSFQTSLRSHELDPYRRDIQPNLPWADDHFQERVSGEPLNPGVQWANWPWGLHADKFRTENGGKFSHTYMERYWPKRAAFEVTRNGHLQGIRYNYGDLNDVVNHLLGDPLTRQAYLPVWFPEDTGVVHGERVPCSLGYHWILRNGYLHTTYYIRSCDFVRHFRDDLYLTVRLSLWLLEQLRHHPYRVVTISSPGQPPDPPEIEKALKTSIEPTDKNMWWDVNLGFLTFHCVSMHCFQNDWNKLYANSAV